MPLATNYWFIQRPQIDDPYALRQKAIRMYPEQYRTLSPILRIATLPQEICQMIHQMRDIEDLDQISLEDCKRLIGFGSSQQDDQDLQNILDANTRNDLVDWLQMRLNEPDSTITRKVAMFFLCTYKCTEIRIGSDGTIHIPYTPFN